MLLKKIDFREERNATLILETMKTSLSDGFEEIKRSESFLKSCNKIVNGIGKHQKLQVCKDPVVKNKYDLMYTLALIDSVKRRKKKIPPSEIKKKLEYFPNIISFFGREKLEEKIGEPCHSLVDTLTRASIPEDHVKKLLKKINHPASLCYDMDASLGIFEKNEKGTRSIRAELLDKTISFRH